MPARRGQLELFAARRTTSRRQRAPRADVAPRPRAPHLTRPELRRPMPVHVTLRALPGTPSFRTQLVERLARSLFAELGAPEEAAAGAPRARRRHPRPTDAVAARFHVAHWSLQRDHVHLLVEATDRAALSAGMRRLVIRLAKRINQVVRRSSRGKVWAERYHRHDLASPREVRRALVYVLQNGRKHGRVGRASLDPFSSAVFFGGFRDVGGPRVGVVVGAKDPFAPRTWLLRVGWQRAGGALRLVEAPRPPPPRAEHGKRPARRHAAAAAPLRR